MKNSSLILTYTCQFEETIKLLIMQWIRLFQLKSCWTEMLKQTEKPWHCVLEWRLVSKLVDSITMHWDPSNVRDGKIYFLLSSSSLVNCENFLMVQTILHFHRNCIHWNPAHFTCGTECRCQLLRDSFCSYSLM